MEFAVESWDPDYGTVGDASGLEASADVVDFTVEFDASAWAPVDGKGDTPPTVFFVDGVRRIDARIWVRDGAQSLGGSCATVAAGVVACSQGQARVVDARVIRGVFTPPIADARSIATAHGTYEHFEVRTGSPEDLYLGIHDMMTKLESDTVPQTADGDLIVFDGPLRGRDHPQAIGLIKTQHVQYLPIELQEVVVQLNAGQRTPLFTIGASRFARYSWYVRLPAAHTHGWAGIVRCELSASHHTSVSAATLASMSATMLCRFASEPHKEPRAPQNLYPIKGLEEVLRRRLGDQRLLHRALRSSAGN